MIPRLRVLIALSLSLVFGGCVQSTEPFQLPVEQARESARTLSPVRSHAVQLGPRLRTSVEVTPRRFVTGSLVTLNLSVTNHEREPVTLHFGATCQLLFIVYDRHGAQVSESWICGFFPTTLSLGAGETVRRTEGWLAAHYDYSQHADVPLPPGPYRIHAYLPEHGYLSPPFVVQVQAQ